MPVACAMELKTARLTILIDPSTKAALESACKQVDMTPSQVVRRLIRDFLQEHAPVAKPARAAKPKAKR